jgi:hypothetical protein
MTRICLLALLLAGCATTTPTGGGGGGTGYGTGEPYFPFIDGANWVYDVSVDGANVGQLQADHSMVGNGATARGAHARFIGHLPWANPAGLQQAELTLRQTAGAITATDAAGGETQLLALPLGEGTTWTLAGQAMRVAGQQDVTVAAGSFPGALHVTGGDTEAWLARGTGVVKLKLGKVGAELRSFTP